MDRWWRWAVFGVLVAVVLGGCDDPRARLLSHRETAASNGRAAAADALAADIRGGRVRLDLALDHAFHTLDQGNKDYQYLGAVLDAADQVSDLIPEAELTNTLILHRIGRLAFRGAQTAAEENKVAEARGLVLSGPTLWQTDGYWMTYPDHDALAAVLMATTGQRREALARLGSRPVLLPPADEALALIRNMGP